MWITPTVPSLVIFSDSIQSPSVNMPFFPAASSILVILFSEQDLQCCDLALRSLLQLPHPFQGDGGRFVKYFLLLDVTIPTCRKIIPIRNNLFLIYPKLA